MSVTPKFKIGDLVFQRGEGAYPGYPLRVCGIRAKRSDTESGGVWRVSYDLCGSYDLDHTQETPSLDALVDLCTTYPEQAIELELYEDNLISAETFLKNTLTTTLEIADLKAVALPVLDRLVDRLRREAGLRW